jgi:hypothetical protein
MALLPVLTIINQPSSFGYGDITSFLFSSNDVELNGVSRSVCTFLLFFRMAGFLLAYYCCTGGTLQHFQKYLEYILVRFTLSIILLYPSSPLLSRASTGLIVPFSYMSMTFPTYSPSYILSLCPAPLPLLPTSRQDLFYLPVLHLKKKRHFLLIQDSYTGSFIIVSPCLYLLSPDWFIPPFSPFYLNPLLR